MIALADILHYLPYGIIGLVAGIVSGLGGSGGMILVPTLIAIGMPPQLAVGTTRISSLGSFALMSFRFNKAKKIKWEVMPKLVAISIIFAILGTFITLSASGIFIKITIVSIVLIVAPISLFHKDFGLKPRKVSPKETLTGYISFAITMIISGMVGMSSALESFIGIRFLGLTVLEAHATFAASWAVPAFLTSIIFMFTLPIDYAIALVIFINMAIGGYIGSHVAVKIDEKWVKYIVFGTAIIVALKVLIETF